MLNRVLYTALRSLEDPIGTARPLWRDYSSHNGPVNFDIAKLHGVNGFAARAGISWGYQDKWFPRNWVEGGRVGIYRTSYHVLYPGQPASRQADNWYRIHPERDIIPRVIDLEVDDGTPPERVAATTWAMSEIVLARDGIRPLIYTRYLLFNKWIAPYWTISEINDHFYWLAQYRFARQIEHAGPPTLPSHVREDRVVLHQTADKKPGFPGEVTNSAADYDRWELGTEPQMNQWISNTWGGSIEPQDPEDIDFSLAADSIGNIISLQIEVNK